MMALGVAHQSCSPIMTTHLSKHHADATAEQLLPTEFDLLQAAYVEYAEVLRDPCSETSKTRMLNLSGQLQVKGIHGNNALHLIQKYSSQINWQGMSPEAFNSFYRFVYFLCRGSSKRHVQVHTAVAAWRLVLQGRFRLLDRWCAYVGEHHKAAVVLEDTWRQVLDFSRTVHEDLSNYDPASAWPVLLDEFVEHLKGQRHPHRPAAISVEPLDMMLTPWSVRASTAAMSPRSGSKRRSPDIMEVADQLQQLPALSSDQAAAAASPAAAELGTGASISGSLEQRQHLVAKRFKMAVGSGGAFAGASTPPGLLQRQQQQHGMVPAVQCVAGAATPSDVAAMPGQQLTGALHMSPTRLAALQQGANCGRTQLPPHHHQQQQQHQQHQQQQQAGALFTPGSSALPGSSSSSHHGHHGHHPRLANKAADAQGAAGLASAHLPAAVPALGHPKGLTAGPALAAGLEMQQQQLSSAEGMMDTADAAAACKEPSQDMMEVSTEAGAHQQWQQAHQQPHPAPQLPARAAIAPVFGAARLDSANIRRTSSVIAMMQVTVTEALGFN